ncbi:hypothetical protein [Lederbergia galactosidilytica]|uniref:DUF4352 domain-containing protein n=1 Tax=Lederbergia galactosidilytica TaxID=217031 RepID=A0A177ZQ08_9BACI|nr:hypothetical protein [Lederbergia galactosidilytica]KRG12988.1 hypothetical protein ACA30_16895 [Virgibacillus soli]OAK70047.1 hypothetical protein ABB05_12745 [Lederbergia galactosidilytica]
MVKKIWFLLIIGLISFTLAACGDSESTGKVPAENETNEDNENKSSAERQLEWAEEQENENDEGDKTDARIAAEESGEWEEADFGKIKVAGVGYNDEVGIDGTDSPGKALELGPVKLHIDSLTVIDIEPDEDNKEYLFDGKDKVKAVIIDMQVENTSDDDIEFYPNQSILVTDTGEQVESDMLLMGEAGGEFFGKVKKEGQTWWILKDSEKDIKTIKMIISPPHSADEWEDLAEEKRLEFEVLSFEEAKKRDGE